MRFKNLNWRFVSQLYFLLLCLTAGAFLFQAVLLIPELGTEAFAYRFPMLEAFLPISAMVGLKYWLFTGEYDPVHPAGLTILLLAVLSAFLLKRGFCSHICPIGTVSEYTYKLRQRIVPRRLQLPKPFVYVLKVPKYLLICFLAFVVLISMSGMDIVYFIRSPYNMISEIKMMNFFLDPSPLTIKVVLFLTAASLLLSNFWCRFLCPYGALLSIFAAFSSVSIRRDEKRCASCHSCEQACLNQLSITDRSEVDSPDCTLCQSCTAACPKGALEARAVYGRYPLHPRIYAGLLLGLFGLGILLAVLSGHWQSAELAERWAEYAPMAGMIFH